MKTITIIDDNHTDYLLLNTWLSQDKRYKILNHFYSGIDALKNVSHIVSDICIIDTYMPLLTGMETTFLLLKKGYPGKIIGVSHAFHKDDMIKSKDAGANAYCRKEENAIFSTMAKLETENICFDSAHFVDWEGKNSKFLLLDRDEDYRIKLLNPHFKKILLLSSKGLKSEEIGCLLGLKKNTVNQYRADMLNPN